MMTRFEVQIARRITFDRTLALLAVPVLVVVHARSRRRRMLAAMRNQWPGMKTRQDHRQKAKEDDP